MNSTEQTTWQQGIAEAARPTLEANGVGAVVVGLDHRGQSFLSRFYALADYADSRKLSAVAWGRARRCFNDDTEGGNYYVVNRYEDGTIIVYNGPHSILWEG